MEAVNNDNEIIALETRKLPRNSLSQVDESILQNEMTLS